MVSFNQCGDGQYCGSFSQCGNCFDCCPVFEDQGRFGLSLVRPMVIRVYSSLDACSKGKTLFCARVSCKDAFSFEKSLDVFRSIYGSDVVIEFLCV